MDQPARRRVEDYVRPLAIGLDGVTNYGDVRRAVSAAMRVAGDRSDVDVELLFLLAVFSGQEKWVSQMGHRSRTELFLAGEGVARSKVSSLFRSLARFDSAPRTPEEEIVHDAVRLDRLGAYGVARSLVDGYRERLDFIEMAAEIEESAAVELRTPQARHIAEPRRRTMLDFAARLRLEFTEFESG